MVCCVTGPGSSFTGRRFYSHDDGIRFGTSVFTSRVHPRLFASMLGMAAGEMVAACFWSLLAPANSLSNGSWLPAAFGFLRGGAFLLGIDALLPSVHPALSE